MVYRTILFEFSNEGKEVRKGSQLLNLIDDVSKCRVALVA